MMAATMIFATSCENDLDLGAAGETSVVSFTVNTPEMSRAYSDGTTATVLQYAVYDANGTELEDLTVIDGEIHGSTTVKLKLTTGNSYSVIFWAAAEDAPYEVDFANKKMTVDYTNAVSNDEARDAFYAVETFTVTGAQTETIELRRPFAQLNIGTADYEESEKAGYTPTQSAVTVKNVYSTLNLWDGTVDENTTVEANFGLADIKKDENFPVTGSYEYIAMNYLLVAAEQELVEVEFTYTDGSNAKTRTVGSVPVQRNYRTNIYGNILTSEVDINVTIKPEYEEPSLEASLQYAAQNGGVVKLTQDVKLDNPIQVKAGKVMVIDLNGYTISGEDKNTSGNYYLIDNRGTLTIKDSGNSGKISLTSESNRQWDASSVVVANNPGGKLTIDGGNIEHFGGTDMAYAVDNLTNGKGTYAETVINGGTIKSTYRAVRQFLNGIEAKNILTVNGGTIEGANKSIWMQDPSTNANTGTLTVGEGAALKGDVYLYVAAGSTEWPVSVSIAEYALKNDSKVLSANVPDGYSVVVADGNYIVVDANVDAVVNNAGELSAALSNDEITTIYLATGEYGTIVAKSNKTIIGSANAKVDAVNLNGAANLTLKNIKFDAATAKIGYDGSGKAKQYANIITGDATKPAKGAWNLVIDGCEFTGKFANGGAAIAFTDQNRSSGGSGNVTIKNCVFDTENSYYDIYGHYTGNGKNGYGDFVIENNTFKSARTQGGPVYLGRYASSTPVVVKDNAFKTVRSLEDAVYVQDHSNYGVSIDASGNTFAN